MRLTAIPLFPLLRHHPGITINAIVLGAYALGNALSQFMWQSQYKPRQVAPLGPYPSLTSHRNHIPWAIISATNFSSALAFLLLRFLLAADNHSRDASSDSDIPVSVVVVDLDGMRTKVPKAFLDLTDRQNRDFRYPL